MYVRGQVNSYDTHSIPVTPTLEQLGFLYSRVVPNKFCYQV